MQLARAQLAQQEQAERRALLVQVEQQGQLAQRGRLGPRAQLVRREELGPRVRLVRKAQLVKAQPEPQARPENAEALDLLGKALLDQADYRARQGRKARQAQQGQLRQFLAQLEPRGRKAFPVWLVRLALREQLAPQAQRDQPDLLVQQDQRPP